MLQDKLSSVPGSVTKLRLILGDQLNAHHSWYQAQDSDTLYLIAELHQEATYVPHHIQKIQAFFCAMHSFATALEQAGHQTLHLTLDDTKGFTLIELILHICAQKQIQVFEYQQADEHRLLEQMGRLELELNKVGVGTHRASSEHFLVGFEEISDYFNPDKKQRMETFYRKMRKRYHILLDDEGEPEGGKWNYDTDNRQKLSKGAIDELPKPLLFSNDVTDINQRIARHQIHSIGQGNDTLLWPVNREQSLQLLDFFCRHCLVNFGRYQDAMTDKANGMFGNKQWSLYHARLSFSMNSKMLHPMQVIQTAIEHYRNNPDITLAQIEGFVRQILGWREFIRGLYWAHMPKYKTLNFLKASRALPKWFWDGDTNMNCQKQAISQSLEFSYAHHIQRLMVTGNFCMLAGIEPEQVDEWYLSIYIDAIEWVELPNTRGMSQFADGGIVGSKAYAASGNYINKMSDYCGDCHYNVKQKLDQAACPLNSLYWHFMQRHRETLVKNPRMNMVYRNWDKQDMEQQTAVLNKAQQLLDDLDNI